MSQIYDIFTQNRKPSYSICYEYDSYLRTLYVSAVAPPESNAGAMREVRFEIKTILEAEYVVDTVRRFLENPDTLSDNNKKLLRQCMVAGY